MPDKYLYFLINIGTILIPLLASFYPKASFYKTWKSYFPAMAITAIFFIAWDVIFTKMGVWGFNPRYLIGVDILGLPVEEWLFFVTVPYACTFTYFSLNYLIKKDLLVKIYRPTIAILIVALFTIGIINYDKYYTCVTFLLTAGFLTRLVFSEQKIILSRFLLMYLMTLVPFFIVNGILTGIGIENQVVWYNNEENLGIRLLTIPIEDTIYGMLLLLMNVVLYERFLKK